MVLIKKILAASFCGDFLKISNRKKKKNLKKKEKKRTIKIKFIFCEQNTRYYE